MSLTSDGFTTLSPYPLLFPLLSLSLQSVFKMHSRTSTILVPPPIVQIRFMFAFSNEMDGSVLLLQQDWRTIQILNGYARLSKRISLVMVPSKRTKKLAKSFNYQEISVPTSKRFQQIKKYVHRLKLYCMDFKGREKKRL